MYFRFSFFLYLLLCCFIRKGSGNEAKDEGGEGEDHGNEVKGPARSKLKRFLQVIGEIPSFIIGSVVHVKRYVEHDEASDGGAKVGELEHFGGLLCDLREEVYGGNGTGNDEREHPKDGEDNHGGRSLLGLAGGLAGGYIKDGGVIFAQVIEL